MFFALAAEKRFKRAELGDSNGELMNTYDVIGGELNELTLCLSTHATQHSRDPENHYYSIRALDVGGPIARAARFIYLNRTCFNGLYRVNKSGKFNVPFGDYKNPTICDTDNLRAVSAMLRSVDTTLSGLDFEIISSDAKRGDAVYFDPPYVPLSATSNFTAYAKEGFGPAEQERLRDCFARLDKKGVHVLLSNSDTPFVRKLYKGFKIEIVEAPRRVNSKGSKRGNVKELLISGRNR